MNAKDIPQEVFEIGILNKDYHERLIADLERVTETAGIPPAMVWSRLSQYCTEADLAWVRKARQGTDNGMVYVGHLDVPVADKMLAITGAFLRNYVDARFMTLQEVLHHLKNDGMPQPTVLLIPNFCMDKDSGGYIAAWDVSSLLGLLYSRLAKNMKTVLYVSSMATLEKNYGAAFKAHLNAHYTFVSK